MGFRSLRVINDDVVEPALEPQRETRIRVVEKYRGLENKFINCERRGTNAAAIAAGDEEFALVRERHPPGLLVAQAHLRDWPCPLREEGGVGGRDRRNRDRRVSQKSARHMKSQKIAL